MNSQNITWDVGAQGDEIIRLHKELEISESEYEALGEHCACEQNQHNSLAKVQDRLRVLRAQRAAL